MMRLTFEEVWRRIAQHEGETFYTKGGLPFTYRVRGSAVCPNRTRQRIPKEDFKKAYERWPVKGPGELNQIVRGPSYVWAILKSILDE
jgi:hypothetical protein